MRFTPAALALSLAFVLTASAGQGAPPQPLDPRAAQLMGEGRAALAAGNADSAIDAFEAALAVQPGAAQISLALAEATRREGMQGKALHYYREAIERDPRNFAAISGEGQALLEKGAVEKAKRTLARLQLTCGANCPETKELAAALARGPVERVVTAEAVKPAPVVTN
ncbi:tetratricopeptide repeat protein [Novosphingobium flavum]|uniref:Tetratricopeptide repeat protein n=1 Tax=Novosphingobium flavum TaxID=1778672 RepID=A0A7X1FSP1_9SPHN|nr:tetratricopeptide repeat protein [Novosphingobium flavum]MBC2666246.1 tetratricopeptide repeat protein [Novosphingobium flavum]